MRCKTCDYLLWSLTARRCPECGDGFRPSDFDFVPSSVRFRCPHRRPLDMGALLEAQNDLRIAEGLPPIPDPRTVRHRAPAILSDTANE